MDRSVRIYPITRSIWLGPFASPERLPALTSTGITHILNVGEAPSVLSAADGPFYEVAWRAVVDLERIPDVLAFDCLSTLHRMVSKPEAKVYVHCVAGWNRSPTIVWLYLVACGIVPAEARRIIELGSPDAIPAHSRLVDAALVQTVQRFGARTFLPHPQPLALETVDPG
jgi:hypothetical protein